MIHLSANFDRRSAFHFLGRFNATSLSSPSRFNRLLDVLQNLTHLFDCRFHIDNVMSDLDIVGF